MGAGICCVSCSRTPQAVIKIYSPGVQIPPLLPRSVTFTLLATVGLIWRSLLCCLLLFKPLTYGSSLTLLLKVFSFCCTAFIPVQNSPCFSWLALVHSWQIPCCLLGLLCASCSLGFLEASLMAYSVCRKIWVLFLINLPLSVGLCFV